MIEKTKTTYIKFKSASGRIYEGKVTFKRPTIADRSRIGVIKARYSEGLQVDTKTDILHEAMATLDVVCVEKPDWLKWEELEDDDVLYHVFLQYKEWETFFRPLTNIRPKKEGKTAEKEVSGTGTEESGGEQTNQVVVQKI